MRLKGKTEEILVRKSYLMSLLAFCFYQTFLTLFSISNDYHNILSISPNAMVVSYIDFNRITTPIHEIEGNKTEEESTSDNRLYRDDDCNPLDSTLCYATRPYPVVDFAMEKIFESDDNTAIYQSPLVADVDGDCIPEIIMAGMENFRANPRLTSGIIFLDSQTGETKFSIQTAMYGWSTPNSFAVADVDGDGVPEIIVAAADHFSNSEDLRGRLICYNLDGSIKWISDEKFGANVTFGYGGNLALADFNGDGIPEVYIYNEIFNAQTGVKLVDGGSNGCGVMREESLHGSTAIGIAADLILDNFSLELVAGYTIYEVEIVNPNGTDGNYMIPHNIEVDGAFRDGFTSIADITGDGNLDVVVASPGAYPEGRVYIYNKTDNQIDLISKASPENGGFGLSAQNIGPPFIGDIDGSGTPAIGITRSLRLITYKYNGTDELEEFWSINTNDHSGTTGMTMFDFNQDGVMEIVYRDETTLRIINGSVNPPEDLAVFSCFSGTGIEHPVVANIDNSGSSKIVVGCGTFIGQEGKMAVFSSPADQQPWAPSRGIWNQYNYHVFNVNDDLTIPREQKNNATYANGLFNNFYVQASLLAEDGTFLQRAPDIGGYIECINYQSETDQYVVNFALFNDRYSSLPAPANVIISFYKSEPVSRDNLLGIYTTLQLINQGDTLADLEFVFDRPENMDTLFMLINIDGNTIDDTLNEDDFLVLECNYDNNIVRSTNFPDFDSIYIDLCIGDSFNFYDSTYDSAGIYFQKLSGKNGCDSLVYQIEIQPIEFIEDTINTIACNSFYWEDTEQEYKESGLYSALVADENGCDTLFFLDLKIPDPWAISTDVKSTCANQESGLVNIQFNELQEDNISAMRLNEQQIDPSSQIIDLGAGTYQLEVRDNNNCLQTTEFTIKIYEEPVVELNDLQVNCTDQSGILKIETISGNIEDLHISWGNGISGPQLFINETGNFNANIESRCSTYLLSAMVFIPEEEQNLTVYVPTAFSPNDDGINDHFTPFFPPSVEFKDYSLKVFDRWGNKVFESNDPNFGWDGNSKEEEALPGVYLWTLYFEALYCEQLHLGKKQGELNLLR